MSSEGATSGSGAAGVGGSAGGGAGDKEGDDEVFNSQGIYLRAQKKLASKLAGTGKLLMDETSARVYDNIYKIVKIYSGSRQRAKKLMKTIIKVNFKIAILDHAKRFSDSEKEAAGEFRESMHSVAEAFIGYRNNRLNQPTNVGRLAQQIQQCETHLLQVIAHHVSDKTKSKIAQVTAFFSDTDFLTTIFQQRNADIKPHMDQVSLDIQEMSDRGII